jgi:ATP-binding cassette subfamily C protein LapB
VTSQLRPLQRPSLPGLPTSLLVGSVAINVLSLAIPLTILQVYDRIVPNAATATLGFMTAGLAVVVVLDLILRVARAWVQTESAARFGYTAQTGAMDRLLAAEPEAYGRENASAYLKRFEALEQLRDHLAGQGRLVAADLPFVALFLGTIYAIGGDLVLGPLVVLVVMAIAALVLGQRLKTNLNDLAQLDDRRYSFLLEVLGRIRTVKALALESLMERRYERLLASNATGTHATVFNAGLAHGLSTTFASLALASVPIQGASAAVAGELSLGALAACTLLAGRTVQPVLRALTYWTQVQAVSIARERYRTLADVPTERTGARDPTATLRGDIALADVAWRPAPDKPFVLKDIDLTVEPGDFIAITGETGAGKSVLLSIIMGLVKPSQGRVAIDRREISDYDLGALRRRIGLLDQRPSLFDGSILENLTLFRPELAGAAMQAARATGLDRQIEHLADGYETQIGDAAGTRLSASLRQQIAITRALVERPSILLLDDPNAYLDHAADENLERILTYLRGSVTIIVVTHRPSMIALADAVYRLSDGAFAPETAAIGPSVYTGAHGQPQAEPDGISVYHRPETVRRLG